MIYILGEKKQLAVKPLTTSFLELTERALGLPLQLANKLLKKSFFCDLITPFIGNKA